MGKPTWLKKLRLNSVDFVRRGANPVADIALFKSQPEEDYVDLAKAEQELNAFTDALGESFSSILKDDSLTHEEQLNLIAKSMNEFNETMGYYLEDCFHIEKSADSDDFSDDFSAEFTQNNIVKSKGEDDSMNYANINKSRLTEAEAKMLDMLIAKASDEEAPKGKGKVNPAQAQEQEEQQDELPPAVKKALAEVEELKKTYEERNHALEMKELEAVAKKYECLGKKPEDEAKILYELKKSGEASYNAYISALDAQVDLTKNSGLFAEIGKSGNYNYTSVAKSEPEVKIGEIAKSYMEKDPTLDYNMAVAKAWENNPDLMAAYEEAMGF